MSVFKYCGSCFAARCIFFPVSVHHRHLSCLTTASYTVPYKSYCLSVTEENVCASYNTCYIVSFFLVLFRTRLHNNWTFKNIHQPESFFGVFWTPSLSRLTTAKCFITKSREDKCLSEHHYLTASIQYLMLDTCHCQSCLERAFWKPCLLKLTWNPIVS